MNLQVSIKRGRSVLLTERLANPQLNDVTASIGHQVDTLKRAAQGPLEPYQADVRHA